MHVRIPFYGIFKCIFFLWLTLPQTEVRRSLETIPCNRRGTRYIENASAHARADTQGSTLIFDRLLAPMFAEHEDDIDAFLGGLRVKAGQGVVGVWGWLWTKVREQARGSMCRPYSGRLYFAWGVDPCGFVSSQLNAAPPPRTDPYAPHSSATQGYPYDQGLGHQPPAIGPQPPTLQDPASGGLAQAYSLASRYALQ